MKININIILFLLIVLSTAQLGAQETPLTYNLEYQNAIISDFQVNENGGYNSLYQYNPSISSDSNGNYVITWYENRFSDRYIYAQRYSNNGIPLGENIIVNDDFTSLNISASDPSVSVDDSGNFVITWWEYRNGKQNIYAQRYLYNGDPLGPNFEVNDDFEYKRCWYPSVAMNGSGNFVITWEEHLNFQYPDIYAQMYSSNGNPIGPNFRVNDDTLLLDHEYPSVSIDKLGNFIISWQVYRHGYGTQDIYGQRYAYNGTPLGINFKVNDIAGDSDHLFPSVASIDSGNFVISWLNEYSYIYAQLYSHDGSLIGTNFKVNDDPGNSRHSQPSTAFGESNFVITWADYRNGNNDIYAQRYSNNGNPIFINFKINDDSISAFQNNPSISIGGNNNFVIAWEDNRIEKMDIYAQRYLNNGNPLGTNYQVNNEPGWAEQENPSLSTDSIGNFVITWQDNRSGNWDIYSQHFSYDGNLLGINFKVNDDTGNANQISPSISAIGSNNYIITWQDNRNGNWDIYAQYFSTDANPIDINFKVNDDSINANQNSPSISKIGNGSFVITWADNRNGNYDIYAQCYLSDCNPFGMNFKINEDTTGAKQNKPSISTGGNNHFIIAWNDFGPIYTNVYAQRYRNNCTVLGTNFKVNNDQEEGYNPAVAADSNDNFVILFKKNYRLNSNIYAQRYSNNGDPIGINFIVNEHPNAARRQNPSISMSNNGNFIITWQDHYLDDANPDIFAQRYLNDGNALGTNFRATISNYKSQEDPDVKLCNGRIYNTWIDNRIIGVDTDIWANVLDWNSPNIIPDNKPHVLSTLILSQNYPNPFNPITTIKYEIKEKCYVNLTVYDISGRKIKTLMDKKQKPGKYVINFNASNLSSGIYIYRLKAGSFEQSRKMIFLR